MKKLFIYLGLSLVFIYGIIANPYRSHFSQEVNNLNRTTNQIKADTIIRFYNDSIGIAFIKDGKYYINNVDTTKVIYTHQNINYKMQNFRIEESNAYFDFIMEGTSTNNGSQQILVSFPCFIDVINQKETQIKVNEFSNVCELNNTNITFTRNASGIINGCITSNHAISTETGKEFYKIYIRDYNLYQQFR